MTAPISLETILVAVPEQVSTDLSGEVVILSMRSGNYFSLDAVGATAWRLMQAPRTLKDIRDAILLEYEVDEERCTRDLIELVIQLTRAELVKVVDVVEVGGFEGE
jgi:hypothetical protein